MSAFYEARAGEGRQSANQPSVAKSVEANLSGLLLYVLYPALWDSDQPKPSDRSLKRSRVSFVFPPLGSAEHEKLGERRRGQQTEVWPTFAVNNNALAPAMDYES